MATPNLHTLTGEEAANIEMGQGGATFFSDTTSRDGTWRMIYHITATVYTTLTCGIAIDGSTFPGSFSFPADSVICGYFTTIKLASGAVLAYKG